MPIPSTPTGPATAALDAVVAAVRREAEGAGTDPFDDALVAAMAGLADVMQADGARLDALGRRVARARREAAR